MNLDGMTWGAKHLRWNGLTFALDPEAAETAKLVLWKTRGLVTQYQAFWAGHQSFQIERVFELGLTMLPPFHNWDEALAPLRLVGVDRTPRSAGLHDG